MVWTETPDGSYEDSRVYDLVSPTIDLSKSRSSTLSFDVKTATEEDDYLWVEASRNGGQDFEYIQVLKGGESPEWSKYTLDMSKFDGESEVRIRFRLRTSIESVDDGVYLENIRVLGADA